MIRTDYVDAINAVQVAAALLIGHDLAGVLAAMEHAEAVGPILDPTLYRDAAARMDLQRRLVAAAAPLRVEALRQRELVEAVPAASRDENVRLRAAVQRLDIPVADIAAATGIPASTLVVWASGVGLLSDAQLARIRTAYSAETGGPG